MIKITLAIVIFYAISAVNLQQTNNLPSNSGGTRGGNINWAIQNLPRQSRRKPCPRSRNYDGNEQWIPSYSSRVTHTISDGNKVLKPQALKNEALIDSDKVASDNSQELRPDVDAKLSNDHDDCNENPHESEKPHKALEKIAIKLIRNCLDKVTLSDQIDDNTLDVISRRSMSDNDDENLSNDKETKDNDNHGTDLDEKAKYDKIEPDFKVDANQDNVKRRANTYFLFNELKNPSRPAGATHLPTKYVDPNNARVCYACSSASNPTCLQPDNRTTVKYCTKDNSCITKTLGDKKPKRINGDVYEEIRPNAQTIIRDCAKSCDASPIPEITPKFNSCTECQTDLCNGAFSISSFNMLIILTIAAVKNTFI